MITKKHLSRSKVTRYVIVEFVVDSRDVSVLKTAAKKVLPSTYFTREPK